MWKIRLILLPLLNGCIVALHAQQDFDKVHVQIAKVAGDVFLLTGQDGNIAADIGDDGIVLVDDEYAALGDKILAALKGVTDKPILFVINTHYHPDHTDGNQYFQKQAPVIAHDNVRKRLESGGEVGNRGSLVFGVVSPQPQSALPILTFDHILTVHLNGEDIQVTHLQNGHTDGDSIVYFPKSNVVAMGDDFLRIGFPFIDLSSGGSVRGLIDALDDVIARMPSDVKVIPGHGPVSNIDDVRTLVTMLKDTRAAVERGCKQGKTLDQLKEEKVLEPWKNWSGPITSDIYLETLYNDITGKSASLVKPQ